MAAVQKNAFLKLRRTGDLLPTIGFGLWKIPKDATAKAVETAIRIGYRHLDAACDYGNEKEVGAGIRAAIDAGIVKREDLWVTSKLWNTYHQPEHVGPALDRTLSDLGLDYLDLYLIHFPIALKYVDFETRYPPEWFHDPKAKDPKMEFDTSVTMEQTWRAMEDLVETGKVRNIGVCNYTTQSMRDLMIYSKIKPAVLQVELHPFLTQDKLLEFCAENDIAVTGFSPLGSSSYVELGMATPTDSAITMDVMKKIAKKHGKTAAQVCLRWGVQRGYSIVPKSTKESRMKENFSILDFELGEKEMDQISALNTNRRFNDPGVFCKLAFNTACPIYD